MPRTYKRRIYKNRDKYSVEQTAGKLTIPANSQAYAVVVPDTNIGGMRKVKHLTVTAAGYEATETAAATFWALVYVPQGTSINNLVLNGSNMYEPNQYVMGCGVFDFNAGPCRIRCPLSRNLNSGDRVVLIMANTHQSNPDNIFYTVQYAVTLQ
jgi:hypothetical protein